VQVKGDPPSACVRGPGSQELILGAPEILSSACSLSSHRFTEFWWRRRELACLQSLADSNPECAVAPRLIDCSPQGIDGSSGRVLVMERVEGQTLRHILEDINGTRTGEGQSALLDLDSIRSALAPKTRLLLAPPVRGCARTHATRAQHDHAEPLRRAGRPRLRRRRRLGARRRETGPPPLPRTDRTSLVPPPVLTGQVSWVHGDVKPVRPRPRRPQRTPPPPPPLTARAPRAGQHHGLGRRLRAPRRLWPRVPGTAAPSAPARRGAGWLEPAEVAQRNHLARGARR